jgi:cellulose synthase/poly-beta-1,6-N-acetylglucosamine synthase-like glycosyltransferase
MGNFGLRILIVMMTWIAISNYIDYKKKRKPHTNPNISIIIPCYNDGHTIQETIHSVYKSYDNDKIELIIVNDKSKDNSREKILELQPKYNFIFKENEYNK